MKVNSWQVMKKGVNLIKLGKCTKQWVSAEMSWANFNWYFFPNNGNLVLIEGGQANQNKAIQDKNEGICSFLKHVYTSLPLLRKWSCSFLIECNWEQCLASCCRFCYGMLQHSSGTLPCMDGTLKTPSTIPFFLKEKSHTEFRTCD